MVKQSEASKTGQGPGVWGGGGEPLPYTCRDMAREDKRA